MKKIISVLLIAIICLGALVGCGEIPTAPAQEQSNYEQQAAANEDNAKAVSDQYGVPTINRSLDYENVKRRAEYLNQGNNIGYLYLLTVTGQVIREVQVLGKVTSLNTYITPMEEIVKVADGSHRYESWGYPDEFVVVQAPDLDGTYGENIQGIFWFTPDGVYGEWPGLYHFSSERLTFTDTELLIITK